jgi:hypothetical protein
MPEMRPRLRATGGSVEPTLTASSCRPTKELLGDIGLARDVIVFAETVSSESSAYTSRLKFGAGPPMNPGGPPRAGVCAARG